MNSRPRPEPKFMTPGYDFQGYLYTKPVPCMMAAQNLDSLLDSLPLGHLPQNVDKQLIHAGKGPMPDYSPGSRVTFHFRTTLLDEDGTLLDDSRNMGKPMELITGKKFKIEIWEAIVRTMAVGEVATFTVPKQFTSSYPLLSKTLRDAVRPSNGHGHEKNSHHCCGMMTKGCGYPDLDKLFGNPVDMNYTFEILRVEKPGEYEKESWLLTEDEKIKSIPALKEEGNAKFSSGDIGGAKLMYHEAIARIEQLALKEKPGSDEMKAFEVSKVPLLLNYAFCLIKSEEFYEALDHLNTVLSTDPENVKGYFRRGICYGKVGDFDKGRLDLNKALELDNNLKLAVTKELKIIAEYEIVAVEKEKERTKKMFAA